MLRRLPVIALLALLAAPAVRAAPATALTIYSATDSSLFSGGARTTLTAGHAVVHATRRLAIAAGTHEVRIDGLPATVDPEAIFVRFPDPSSIAVLGQRIILANASASNALDSAIGSLVSVRSPRHDANGGGLTGVLLGATHGNVILRTADGKIHLLHAYTSMTLPAGSMAAGDSLLLDLDAKATGARDAVLTYTTAGLGWRAAYTAVLTDGSPCRMHFKPEASIANRSGHDYAAAAITLIAGQPNFGTRGIGAYRMTARAAVAAAPMPQPATLGDYRSFALPRAISLESGTVTLTPLYPSAGLACRREYLLQDGGTGYPARPNLDDYGAPGYRDRPIPSTLAFTAPDALPAGTLRAWTRSRDGALQLLGEGGVADTLQGQPVAIRLGQSFDLRASRERTAFHVDPSQHRMTEAYRISLRNGGNAAHTVTVREHPNRWRQWTITKSSIAPSRQTPQMVEFEVPVPAHGEVTLSYTIRYTWTATELKG